MSIWWADLLNGLLDDGFDGFDGVHGFEREDAQSASDVALDMVWM